MKADDKTDDTSRSDPIVIDEQAVYTLPAASEAVGINAKFLAAALRSGELRGGMRARQFFVAGSALKAWLLGGEIPSNSKGKRTPKKAKVRTTTV